MKRITFWIVLTAILFVLMLALYGCQTAPDKASFITDDCYAFADCMYRLQKGQDKTACAVLAEACRDSLKERRMYQRLEYCRTKCPQGMSESECRLYLNQK